MECPRSRRLQIAGIAVVLALCSTGAVAQRYRVGNDSLAIPPPSGLVTVASHSKEMPDTIRATFPAGMNVIDVFVTKADLDAISSPPSLDRFFSVSVVRGYENFRATPKQFAELLPEYDKTVDKMPDGTDPILRREPWGVFSAISPNRTRYADLAPRYCVNAFALISEIPLQFLSCVPDRGDSEREWLRTTMNAWIDTVHRINLPKGPSPKKS